MLGLKLRPCFANGAEWEKPTVADRFAQALAHLSVEYDLPADVWEAAENILEAFRAGERKWAPR
jgi:hypothetical protein